MAARWDICDWHYTPQYLSILSETDPLLLNQVAMIVNEIRQCYFHRLVELLLEDNIRRRELVAQDILTEADRLQKFPPPIKLAGHRSSSKHSPKLRSRENFSNQSALLKMSCAGQHVFTTEN